MYSSRSSCNKDPPGFTIRSICLVSQLYWINTNFRTHAKNDFGIEINDNVIFGKTENIWNHVNIQLITKWNGRYIAKAMIAKPNFHSRLRGKFDRCRTAQTRGEVQQADLCGYVYSTYRKSACTNFTSTYYWCIATNARLCTCTDRNDVPWRSVRGATHSYRSAHILLETRKRWGAKGESSEGRSDILSLAQSAQLKEKA